MPKGNAQICILSSQTWSDFFFVLQKMTGIIQELWDAFIRSLHQEFFDIHVKYIVYFTKYSWDALANQALIWKCHIQLSFIKLWGCQLTCGQSFSWSGALYLCTASYGSKLFFPLNFKEYFVILRHKLSCWELDKKIDTSAHLILS